MNGLFMVRAQDNYLCLRVLNQVKSERRLDGRPWDFFVGNLTKLCFSKLCVAQTLAEVMLFHIQKLVWKCWQCSGCRRPRLGNEQGEQGERTVGSVTGSTQRMSLRSLTK